MKEYKIGEKFEIEGVEYVCKQDDANLPCIGCRLLHHCGEFVCASDAREDRVDVHFEKVNQ